MMLNAWIAFVRWTLRRTDYVLTTGEALEHMTRIAACHAEQRVLAMFSTTKPDDGKRHLWMN